MGAVVIPASWTALVSSGVKSVPWLAAVGERGVAEIIAAGERVAFRPGQIIVGELEVGDALFLILDGQARATVGTAERRLGDLGPGSTCGELAVLTRDLRSATVRAVTPVKALRIEREEFETILRRYPRAATHFVRELAIRLGDADRALDELLTSAQAAESETVARVVMTQDSRSESAFARAWRELVVSRRHELPFVGMTSFLGTLAVMQLLVQVFRLAGWDLFDLLRNAYTMGFAIVIVSAGASLVRFSAGVRRVLAIAYGVGFALIVNQLSVFLAFDTFYLDMTTPDPRLRFSVEQLYRRSESDWAIAIVLAVLAQVTYLRRFYRRILFLLLTKIRARFAGS